jgi:hypothetical protein
MVGGQERDLKRLAGWSSDVMLERYGASAADARAAAAARKRGPTTGRVERPDGVASDYAAPAASQPEVRHHRAE